MMVSRETTKVPFDAYFIMTVTWKGGFSHTVPCRGFNLKSHIKFTESLEYVDTYEYVECTQEEYDLKVFGDGSDFEENTNGRASKTKAQQKNPTKTKPRTKRNEDSKAVRNPSGKSPRATQEKSTSMRKSEVRNVRKPKKDVARTNNPGKKTAPRTRSSKSKTQ